MILIPRTGTFRPLLPAVLLLAALAGCAGNKPVATSQFMKSVNAIEAGTPMEQVREKLGAPDERREGEGPPRPAPPVGSPEGVLVTVPPKVEYVPSVAELPTCQKTLQGWASLTKATTLDVAVVTVEPTWKIQTASG